MHTKELQMLTGDALLAKVKELCHTESTKPLSQEQSIARTQRGMTEELAQDPANPPVNAL